MNYLLYYLHLFRICKDASCSLWCCWSETNIRTYTAWWVSIHFSCIMFNYWEGCNNDLKEFPSATSRVLPINWTVGMVGILAGTVEDALIVLVVFSVILYLQQGSYKIGFTASIVPLFIVMQLSVVKFHHISPPVHW